MGFPPQRFEKQCRSRPGVPTRESGTVPGLDVCRQATAPPVGPARPGPEQGWRPAPPARRKSARSSSSLPASRTGRSSRAGRLIFGRAGCGPPTLNRTQALPLVLGQRSVEASSVMGPRMGVLGVRLRIRFRGWTFWARKTRHLAWVADSAASFGLPQGPPLQPLAAPRIS